MKTSVNIWDAFFGEKISLDLPMADGTTKKVVVTKRWMEKLSKEGLLKNVSTEMVKVNILGPEENVITEDCTDPTELMNALMAETILIEEYWRIGDQITKEEYEKFIDTNSNELYALRRMEIGGSETFLVQRSMWEHTRQLLGL